MNGRIVGHSQHYWVKRIRGLPDMTWTSWFGRTDGTCEWYKVCQTTDAHFDRGLGGLQHTEEADHRK